TTRKRRKPKLLMARAAAPMLRGLRAFTSTTRNRSDSDGESKNMILRHVFAGAGWRFLVCGCCGLSEVFSRSLGLPPFPSQRRFSPGRHSEKFRDAEKFRK